MRGSLKNWLSKERLDHETLERKQFAPKSKRAKIIIISVILLFFATFYFSRIIHYFTWFNSAENQKHVINLTERKHKWNVYYGNPVKCGNIDCHLKPDYSPAEFTKKMVLPAREFPLQGYQKGQIVYLSTKLKIPPALLELDTPLSFYTVYVWAKRWDLYFNGRLYDSGGEETLLSTIPKHEISPDGGIHVAFRIDPEGRPFQGIANKKTLLLGPKNKLISGLSWIYEEMTTRILIFLIPTALIGLVFSILYTSIYRFNETFYFILFGFFASINLFFKSEYGMNIGTEDFSGLSFAAPTFLAGQYFLLLFIHNFFRRKSSSADAVMWYLGVGIFSFIGVYLFSYDVRVIIIKWELMVRSGWLLRQSSFLYGIILSYKVSGYLKKNFPKNFRLITTQVIGYFFLFFFLMNFLSIIKVNSEDYFYYAALTTDVLDLSLFILLATIVSYEFAFGFLQRNKIKGAFSRYLDDQIVNQIATTNQKIPFEHRYITSFFLDIRSFTSISEVYGTKEIKTLLEDFREKVIPPVKDTNGYIDRFSGDGMVAMWGAVSDIKNHQYKAAMCAIKIRKIVKDFNEQRKAQGSFEIRVGMGMASGDTLAGEIGNDQKSEFTMIGDNINLASRIEAMTKEFSTDILMAESTYLPIKDKVIAIKCSDIEVRGVQREVNLYKLVGIFDESGEFHCDDECYLSKLPENPQPGLIEVETGNIEFINYCA